MISIKYFLGTLAALFMITSASAKLQKDKPGFRGSFDVWQGKPIEKFKDAKANFEKVKSILLKRFVDKKLSEDQLYFAATKGMLESLNKGERKWNKLISPSEFKELQVDITGKLSGIGIVLKFNIETGISNVLEVIPGGPAQKSGIRGGDQVISVNGKLYKNKQFRDLIYDIRGKTGQSLTLRVLRGDRVISKKVIREKISWSPVESTIVSDYVGLIIIRYFSETTTQLIKSALNKFKDKKVSSLVLDLRGNSGGLFDQAVNSADLFLSKGRAIVKTKARSGKSEVIKAKTDSVISNLPIVVLVDNMTSSGAELFSASINENLNAKIVGQRTFGKWNAQTIELLPNKFAVKYSVKNFTTPSGKSYGNVGLSPDVEIAGSRSDEPKHVVKNNEKILPLKDPQLKTAINLVKIMI